MPLFWKSTKFWCPILLEEIQARAGGLSRCCTLLLEANLTLTNLDQLGQSLDLMFFTQRSKYHNCTNKLASSVDVIGISEI